MAEERILLRIYKQLADTMKTLIEIQRLEVEEVSQQQQNAKEPPAMTTVSVPTKKKNRKKILNVFGDDSDDIRRFDTVPVFVHVEVIRMGEVDTKNQKFESEMSIISRWLEPELNRRQKEFVNEPTMTCWDYWDPKLFVENGVAGNLEKTTYRVLFDLQGTAMVEENRYVRGYFKSPLELYDYPFDVQDLTIKVGSQRSRREISFMADPVFQSTMNTNKFNGHHEWKLEERIKIRPSTYIDVMKIRRQVKPAVSASFKTKRHGMYFVWNVTVFIIVISSLAFSTFAIDCTNLPARLPLTFILLLSNVTFKFAVNKSLPKISYLTYMDNYVLTSLIIMVVLSMWHTAIATIDKYTKTIDAKLSARADYAAMAVLCVIYVVFNSTFIAKTKFTVRKARKQKEKLQKSASAMTLL